MAGSGSVGCCSIPGGCHQPAVASDCGSNFALLRCHVQERVAKLVVQLRERLAAYSTLGKDGFEQVRLRHAVS